MSDQNDQRSLSRRKLLTMAGAAGIAALASTLLPNTRESRAVAAESITNEISLMNFPRKGRESDDTARIKRALIAIKNGGTLSIPPQSSGNPYYISDQIALPERVTVRGPGVIKQMAREKNIFMLNNDNVIDCILFEGSYKKKGAEFALNNGVYAQNKRRVTIRNCTFRGFEAAGINIRDCHDVIIENNFLYDNYWSNFSNSSDICLYSAVEGRRAVIKNNFCLSDNSQGIFVNPMGVDSEIIIDGNICSTINSNMEELTKPLMRRHGIVVAYSGSKEGSKVILTNNIVKNTKWTGIYSNNSNGNLIGEYVISSNIVMNTSLDSSAKISGGIVCYGSGFGDIIANNIIENIPNAPAIKINNNINASGRTVVHHNTIKKASCGIYASFLSQNITIDSNTIKDSEKEDIYIGVPKGTLESKIKIMNNHIEKSTAQHAIFVDNGYCNNIVTINSNEVIGPPSAGVKGNSAIYLRKTERITVRDNNIRDFKYGVYYEDQINGRLVGKIFIKGNMFEELEVGIVLRSNTNAAVVPVVSNTFINTKVDLSGEGSYCPGYIGETRGSNLILFLSSVPQFGTFQAGDRFENPNPEVGGIEGGVCVKEGSPGVWKVRQLGVKSTISSSPSFIGEMAIVDGHAYIGISTLSSNGWKRVTN